MIKKFNKDLNLKDLQQYMLYSVDDNNEEKLEQESHKQGKKLKLNDTVPQQQIYVKYTKKYSKYNEPFQIKDNNLFKDKLFWCFYKLLNNYQDKDLENINSFKIEKDFKFGVIEQIRKNKHLLKTAKIRKFSVEDDLINSKYITLQTFECLCLIYNINIVLLKDNKTYATFCYDIDNPVINIDNYKIIKLVYDQESSMSKNFDVEILDLKEEELQKIINSYYYLDNLEKPLKAYSGYKLVDLMLLANKLNIILCDVNAKAKKKKELYEDILKVLK